MRRVSVLLSVLALVIAGSVALGRAPSNAVAQDATPAAGAGIVGSWRVAVTPDEPAAGRPPGPSLATFGADGTMLGSGPPVILTPPWAPFPRAIAGPGHGTWEATGPQSVAYTFVLLLSEEGGTAYAVVTISGTAELDASGDAWAGEYTATVVGQIRGVLATAHGTLSGTRLKVEPMATPAAGTPAAGTPVG